VFNLCWSIAGEKTRLVPFFHVNGGVPVYNYVPLSARGPYALCEKMRAAKR